MFCDCYLKARIKQAFLVKARSKRRFRKRIRSGSNAAHRRSISRLHKGSSLIRGLLSSMFGFQGNLIRLCILSLM
jgi:hypothetical protein